MNTIIPEPHGGQGLVNRFVPAVERNAFLIKAEKYPSYRISDSDLSVFYRIADGGLSPLEGPMCADEFNAVLEDEFIERDGRRFAWTIPISFPAAKEEADSFTKGKPVAVKTAKDEIIGVLEVEDIFPFDKARYNQSVYGTERTDHPGPRIVNDDSRTHLVGGRIWALPHASNAPYAEYMLNPEQTRNLFQERQWQRTVAFQTRNALHRAHEYAMVYAVEKLTREGAFAGVVLNPLVGATKSDDVPADVRMRTYEALIANKLVGAGDRDDDLWKEKGYTLADQLVLIGLDMKMFYAGPKEAIMHAIYRQNYGFTDIVIGRKHADAPFDDGKPVWGDFDAHEKFENLKGELEIKPAKVGFAAFFEEIGRVGLIEIYKDKGYKTVSIAGKALRAKLQAGEAVDERIMRKPVADILIDFYRQKAKGASKSTNVKWHASGIGKQDREQRSGHRGSIIWLTGLPSSGKSTIAVELEKMLFGQGYGVYVLDGDNIRHGLNKNLGFSPEDREENIRRIGEVARLFCDAGLLVVTAFISPYRKDRDRVRSLVGEGDFIEVFIDTPLSVCEARDPKGLYKKARSGVIPEFTGVSAPYEAPAAPEITVETDGTDKAQSAQVILEYLSKHGYIKASVRT